MRIHIEYGLPFVELEVTFRGNKLLLENVVRNDPDGRSRLNVNIFTGDIIVTDFGDIPEIRNIQAIKLEEAYEKVEAFQSCKRSKLPLPRCCLSRSQHFSEK